MIEKKTSLTKAAPLLVISSCEAAAAVVGGGGVASLWRRRASALLATQPLIARDGGRGLEPAADAPRSSGVCPGSQGGCRTRTAELSAC